MDNMTKRFWEIRDFIFEIKIRNRFSICLFVPLTPQTFLLE